jgi:teichuronic acid biosynthesis glycosyltransferase TuaC
MSKGLSVAFLVTDYPTVTGNSAGVFHRTLAEALVRAGAEVEVVAPVARAPWPLPSLSRKYASYNRIPGHYRLGGVVVHRPRRWQVPRGNYLGVGHESFARCLTKTINRVPDVVHAHFAYPCGLGAVRAASRWGVPVVLTLHGGDVNVLPEKSRWARRFFLAAVREATSVLAVSEALADRTEQLTGRRPRVSPIGIDLSRYRDLPDLSAAREQIGLPAAARIVLFVGNLVAAKGVLLLLDALERMRRDDVLAVFVGGGPLRSTIANAPGAISVGEVPNEKVPIYMRAADILVLPSFSEGMPTVVVEAGAAGLPVIGTAIGGMKELLCDNRGLLIPEGDAAELAAAIQRVLVDRTGALERARLLKDYVDRAYDVDENARATLRTYESLL